ncbi:hypothetical protein [Actinobaculum sp. 352]|uniref:hypothetical protein n=1 Tax=Actinobaculum sp. 352 TaxID=2490946 RepID=UPI0019D19D40|nr:hypothetical protein [Actinobaculum sp. 352]
MPRPDINDGKLGIDDAELGCRRQRSRISNVPRPDINDGGSGINFAKIGRQRRADGISTAACCEYGRVRIDRGWTG